VKRTALLALLLLGGCVSFNARAQVGPTADTGGRGGVSAMVMAGFGWTGDRSAAFWAAGAESDNRVAASADVVRIDGGDWGVRAGGHSVSNASTNARTSLGFHTALLYPLRSMQEDLVKRKAHLFVAVETRAGVCIDDRMRQTNAEFGAALGLELLYKMDDAM
jgi:hypothetical protein